MALVKDFIKQGKMRSQRSKEDVILIESIFLKDDWEISISKYRFGEDDIRKG